MTETTYNRPDQIVQLKIKTGDDYTYVDKTVADVERDLGLLQQTRETIRAFNTKVDKLKTYLQNAVENETIDADEATAIGEIFGIELTKRVNLTIKVELDVTVSVPAGEEISIYDFDFSAEHGSYYVEDVDYTVNDWYEN